MFLIVCVLLRRRLQVKLNKSSRLFIANRKVDLVMKQPPYINVRRVFWITFNGLFHRGETSISRLERRWYPNAILVHTPVHDS